MRIVALEWMSLDGVVQSPAHADEDPSGGFEHGGWHRRFFDETSMAWVSSSVVGADAYLFGRGTYEIFAAHWPDAGPEEQFLAAPLNSRPKYVASTRPFEPGWNNTQHLKGRLPDAVRRLKALPGGDLAVVGSPGLVQSLLAHDLLDEMQVMIDPLVIGSGKRLFGAQPKPSSFELVSCVPVTTGAILASYARSPS